MEFCLSPSAPIQQPLSSGRLQRWYRGSASGASTDVLLYIVAFVDRHWQIPDDLFLEPMDEEDLRAAEGADTDEFGIILQRS